MFGSFFLYWFKNLKVPNLWHFVWLDIVDYLGGGHNILTSSRYTFWGTMRQIGHGNVWMGPTSWSKMGSSLRLGSLIKGIVIWENLVTNKWHFIFWQFWPHDIKWIPWYESFHSSLSGVTSFWSTFGFNSYYWLWLSMFVPSKTYHLSCLVFKCLVVTMIVVAV